MSAIRGLDGCGRPGQLRIVRRRRKEHIVPVRGDKVRDARPMVHGHCVLRGDGCEMHVNVSGGVKMQ